VISAIQDELSPDAIILWTTVVKERVGKVSHSFTVQVFSTAEEHSILQRQIREKEK